MSKILGITVGLKTGPGVWSGTDDHIYVGIIGKGGGREFPLDVTGYDDFEPGTYASYLLGTVWGYDQPKGPPLKALHPFASSLGGWNDPGKWDIDLQKIDYVYLRKAGSRSGGDDDLYEMEEVEVVLYGAEPTSRRFKHTGAVRLANEYGLKIFLPEMI